jgi:peptide/nickel transport system substrate-binding protein
VDPGTKIEGIETPDDQTIVFRLSKPTGVIVAGSLAMPNTAPVPEEYARKFDAKNPSTYAGNQVATGPYMYENDADGKVTGYQPGERIHLVRNPNWDKTKDYRPAYVDEWDMPQGNDDTTVASRKILEGSALMNGDIAPDPPSLKLAVTRYKEQLALVPAGGTRWVSMNTKLAPFDDLNVRKAVIAGYDREAGRLARGGPLVGDMPTHYIPPGVPGFEESGGLKGFGFDFMNAPKGDLELAAKYFKAAGFASGKFEGTEEILVVGTSEGVAQKQAEIAKENLEKLGFKVTLRLVTQDAMFDKFCNVPKAEVHVCPNVGWFKDWADPQTLLDPTFNGENILQEGNSNWSQLDVPEINKAMNDANTIPDPKERAEAWAAINRQVTEQAPTIPVTWDKEPLIASSDVIGVANPYHTQWDLSFSQLKG